MFGGEKALHNAHLFNAQEFGTSAEVVQFPLSLFIRFILSRKFSLLQNRCNSAISAEVKKHYPNSQVKELTSILDPSAIYINIFYPRFVHSS